MFAFWLSNPQACAPIYGRGAGVFSFGVLPFAYRYNSDPVSGGLKTTAKSQFT